MKEVTIEKGTTYDELTDEQVAVIDGINDMISEMRTMVDILTESIEYNDPTLGGYKPAWITGFQYTITTDTSKFYRMQEHLNNLYNTYEKVVIY